MKITEEIWEKSASKNYDVDSLPNGDWYHILVTRDILKKHVFLFQVPRKGCYEEYNSEELKKLESYIFDKFKKDYDLIEYGFSVSSKSFGRLGSVSKPYPSLLLGNDLVIRNMPIDREDDSNSSVCLPVQIFYTSESAYAVYYMLNDIISYGKILLETRDNNSIDIKYSIAISSVDGIDCLEKLVNTYKTTLDEFNEDLPDYDIKEFLRSDKSGILIFHGDPGCGKTSYIKHLISECKDSKFVYLSSDMLQGNLFRDFIIENSKRRMVLVVEDCENILRSRNSGYTSNAISDILNISSGLLGDFTKTKFIFTFNTNLSNIDEALLRDGRLACEYEFKPLQGERLENLAKKLGRDIDKPSMSLADLYNIKKPKRSEGKKRIGFNGGV